MGWRDLEKEITDHLHAQLTQGGDGGAAVVTFDPNGRYLDSSLEETTRPTTGTWIAFAILYGEAKPAGTRQSSSTIRERRTGVLSVICHIGLGKGQKRLMQLADRVADVFRGTNLSTTERVRFRTPYLTERRREGEWWRVNVQCPFYSDASVTV